jgi:hypothetical protein
MPLGDVSQHPAYTQAELLFRSEYGLGIDALWIIGRGHWCDVRHPDVESTHAAVARFVDGTIKVVDLGSRSGTYVQRARFDPDQVAGLTEMAPRYGAGSPLTMHPGYTLWIGHTVAMPWAPQ